MPPLRALSFIQTSLSNIISILLCYSCGLCQLLASPIQLVYLVMIIFALDLACGCYNPLVLFFSIVINHNRRTTKILVWNIRGINSQGKWDALCGKIEESARQIVCLQEIKCETFDPFYLKKSCPRYLDTFSFFPSVGASECLLMIWNSSILDGITIQSNAYAITVNFHNRLDNKDFHPTNIYGPSISSEKLAFVTWLINLDTSTFDEWLLAGDFNIIR